MGHVWYRLQEGQSSHGAYCRRPLISHSIEAKRTLRSTAVWQHLPLLNYRELVGDPEGHHGRSRDGADPGRRVLLGVADGGRAGRIGADRGGVLVFHEPFRSRPHGRRHQRVNSDSAPFGRLQLNSLVTRTL